MKIVHPRRRFTKNLHNTSLLGSGTSAEPSRTLAWANATPLPAWLSPGAGPGQPWPALAWGPWPWPALAWPRSNLPGQSRSSKSLPDNAAVQKEGSEIIVARGMA